MKERAKTPNEAFRWECIANRYTYDTRRLNCSKLHNGADVEMLAECLFRSILAFCVFTLEIIILNSAQHDRDKSYMNVRI